MTPSNDSGEVRNPLPPGPDPHEASAHGVRRSLPSSGRNAVQTESITKKFGDLVAVNAVTFEVPEQQSFGLLGPNGAGKSTLIRMLTTLVSLTSGSATIAGHDLRTDPAGVRRSIGVIPQGLTSDPEMTAAENLSFYARLYGLSGPARRKAVDDLLHAVNLHEWRNKPVATFSGGMRRRLEIGRSLLHSPKVLFLDEPTTGLDPVSRLAVWEMLQGLRSEHPFTLFLTTHYMEEADKLCERIGIIDHGGIIAMDTPRSLKARLASNQVIEADFPAAEEGWADRVRNLPAVERVEVSGEVFRIHSVDCVETAAALLREAHARGIAVASLSIRGSSLEDVFVQFTGRDLRDSAAKSFQRDVSHLYEKRR